MSHLVRRICVFASGAFLAVAASPACSHDLLPNLANSRLDSPVTFEQHRSRQHPLIYRQLLNDAQFLAQRPDFYLVVGGIATPPLVAHHLFNREDPELTEHWGHSIAADNFFEAGEIIGNGVFPISVSAASWGIGKIAGSNKLRDFGTDLFRAQAANGFLTLAIKIAVNRRRPNGGSYSYPSGHTSSAFATAGTIYRHFGKTWGIPAMVLAGYVGLSRLQEGKHYMSDVVAGGLLGSYVSIRLIRDTRKKGSSVSVAPLLFEGGAGFSVSSRF